MFEQVKIYIIIVFWALLLYLLSVRKLSLFFQNLFNGRLVRSIIKKISQNNVKSYFSGFGISFLLQSPYAALNHIASYAQSGLISFKQMGAFVSGSLFSNTFFLLSLLLVPVLPKKVIIACLLLSLFFKIFMPKFRFWFIDLLLIVSAFIFSVTELNTGAQHIHTYLSFLANPGLLVIVSFFIALVFKSPLFSGLIFFVLLSKWVSLDNYYLYVGATWLGILSYFIYKTIRYNSSIKKVFAINFVSTICSFIILFKTHVFLLTSLEAVLAKVVVHTSYANTLSSTGDAFTAVDQWLSWGLNFSASQISYYIVLSLSFYFLISVISLVLITLTDVFAKGKLSNKPKEVQSFIFPKNSQFYSPFLYVDHFRQEAKKMAAMLENIINIALDESLHKDSENLLRAKKYNLILERVKTETRDYSEQSLKKIRLPFTNQENLHLLQVTEVVEEISKMCLSLLNLKSKSKKFTLEQKKYAELISNNYDYIFEAFTSGSSSIYPSNITGIKEKTEICKVLNEINISVLELATILKNIIQLRAKSKS